MGGSLLVEGLTICLPEKVTPGVKGARQTEKIVAAGGKGLVEAWGRTELGMSVNTPDGLRLLGSNSASKASLPA